MFQRILEKDDDDDLKDDGKMKPNKEKLMIGFDCESNDLKATKRVSSAKLQSLLF